MGIDPAHERPTPTEPGARAQERAPRLLKTAARLLVVGSLTPWLGARLGTQGALENLGLKLALLAGCGLILVGTGANAAKRAAAEAGEPPVSRRGSLQRWHVLGALGIAAAMFLQYFLFERWWLLGESLTLLLGGLTLAHLHGYEKGGPFNPLFPLMFGACAVGGVFALYGRVRSEQGLAALGCASVTAAGVLATYTIAVALAQAKRQGDLKKAAASAARKQARESMV